MSFRTFLPQSLLLALVFLSFQVSGCSNSGKEDPTPRVTPDKRGRASYYVDASGGSDANEGTSAGAAWKSLQKVNAQTFQPGDSILFRAGSSWQGQFAPKGSGGVNAPIVVSQYGNGPRPLLDGKGAVDHVVLLTDVEFWELNNLEITNNASSVGNRTGIMVKVNSGLRKHIHIRNVYIHDIMGDYSFEMKGKNTGGIGIIAGPTAKVEDILIEDCEIGPVNRVGIFTNLTDAKNATRGNRPITKLVIRRNRIHHCAGDGAIIRYAYKPLIEHNVVYENHNAPETQVEHGVALWCRSTDEALFQYNEVYNTRGKMDGQAFDADLDAYRTVVQYNYSHGNEGGFMLVYGSSSETIVRYNLSVNDGALGKHIFDFPVWTNPRGSGIFHNNTVVIPAGVDPVIADEALESARFYNNIFYNKGSGKLTVPSNGRTAVFSNNSYVGYDDVPDAAALLLDPQLTNPLLYGPGFGQTNGLKLKSSSPAKGKGVSKGGMGAEYWLPDMGMKDFWGNPVNPAAVSLGADQN